MTQLIEVAWESAEEREDRTIVQSFLTGIGGIALSGINALTNLAPRTAELLTSSSEFSTESKLGFAAISGGMLIGGFLKAGQTVLNRCNRLKNNKE